MSSRAASSGGLAAEMSAVTPVFLLPGQLSAAAGELGTAFAGSLTLGAGQFCTNPGIVIGVDGPDLDAFTGAARDAVAGAAPAPMLTGRIAAAYADGVAALTSHGSTAVVAPRVDRPHARPFANGPPVVV